jgi:prophage regulatory protein
MVEKQKVLAREIAAREMRRLLPMRTVLTIRGKGRSSHYNDVRDGLFVRPVRIGLRSKRYPSDEVEAVTAAYIAGKSEDEIRELVIALEAARKAML